MPSDYSGIWRSAAEASTGRVGKPHVRLAFQRPRLAAQVAYLRHRFDADLLAPRGFPCRSPRLAGPGLRRCAAKAFLECPMKRRFAEESHGAGNGPPKFAAMSGRRQPSHRLVEASRPDITRDAADMLEQFVQRRPRDT